MSAEMLLTPGLPMVCSRASLLRKSKQLALTVLLFALFMSLYENLVAPKFFFGGFKFEPRDIPILEWLLVVGSALLMPLRADLPSRMFMWFSFLFILIPASVLSALQSSDRGALLMMYAGTFLVRLILYFSPFNKSKNESLGLYGFALFSKAIVIGYFIVLASTWLAIGGIKTFDFGDVYEYRFDVNESIIFPLNYLIPIFGGALSSLVVAYSLVVKRRGLLGLMILLGVLLFGITTHKLFLFYPFLVILFFALQVSRDGLRDVLLILIAFSGLALMTTNYDVGILGMVFANRGIFLPANIHYEYFREFSNIGFQYWSESKFGLGFVESSLKMPSMNYIGEIMTGDPRVGANTGWVAIGYMNLGFAGIGIYAFILGWILSALDNIAKRSNRIFVTSSVSVPILFLITNGDLLITLLTGGLLFSIMILVVYLRLANDKRSAVNYS